MRHAILLGAMCAAACQGAPPVETTRSSGTDSSAIVAGAYPAPDFPDSPLGREARRGLAILERTRDSLPEHVGNGLRCTSCHLQSGRRAFAMTWVGVHGRYPQYRSRSATIQTLADRINDCFQRSLGGKPLPDDDDRMHAIQAYLALLSRGVAVGSETYGQGIDSVHVDAPDTVAGRAVFEARCIRCHGADGLGTASYPPLWGEASFTIGAGMGRYRTAAGFIRRNMPFDSAGVLSEREALDVAAFVDSRPRRDFPEKERDWPRGNAPSDVPYRTAIGSRQ